MKGIAMRHDMRNGLTRIEVIVVLAIVTTVIVLVLTSMFRIRSEPKWKRDEGHLRGIHQSMLIFAREFNGTFPVPGLIKRLPVERDGVKTFAPGQGEEDITQNTTANLFSVLIMNNYFPLEDCVGRTEPSDKVVFDEDFNWDVYDPANNIHWDENFKADLQSESNVSYAHMPLFGERYRQLWRESLDESMPLLSHRGPKDGNDPNTVTFRIMSPYNAWRGIVIYGDGSFELNTDMLRRGIKLDLNGTLVPDHLFKFDEDPPGGGGGGGGGADAILTFTRSMTAEGPECAWD